MKSKSRQTPAERAANAKRTGRPRAVAKARDKVLHVRLTAGELVKIKAAAKRQGLTVSDWLRQRGISE